MPRQGVAFLGGYAFGAAEGAGLLILSASEAREQIRDALARAAPAASSVRLPNPAPDAHLDELALAVLYIFLVCI